MAFIVPTLVHGDLLDQRVDVLVNAWNQNIIPWWLLLPQGVSGAIKRRGGTAPFRELAGKGRIPLGGAVMTGAGRLPHKAIIHVAGICMLWFATESSIRGSVRSAMHLVDEHGFASVAFPIIGSGSGQRKVETCLAIMQDEFRDISSRAEVMIVQFDKRKARRAT